MARRRKLWWMLGAAATAAAAGAYFGLRWRVVQLTMVPCSECALGVQLYRGGSSWYATYNAADLGAQEQAMELDAASGLVVVHSPLGGEESFYGIYGPGGVQVDLPALAPLFTPGGSVFDLPKLPRQAS